MSEQGQEGLCFMTTTWLACQDGSWPLQARFTLDGVAALAAK